MQVGDFTLWVVYFEAVSAQVAIGELVTEEVRRVQWLMDVSDDVDQQANTDAFLEVSDRR